MGLWLQMTGCFKGAVNYFESKSKAGWVQGVSMPLTFSLLGNTHTAHFIKLTFVWASTIKGIWVSSWHTATHCAQKLYEGLTTRFKMVNCSSEGFIEDLSLVACFSNPLTHRHTPGIGSGYSQAPRLAGQDLVLHRPLIPCMATYLTEGLELRTPYMKWTTLSCLLSCPRFFLPSSQSGDLTPKAWWKGF